MPAPYIQPSLGLSAFHCPHCGVLAKQPRGPVWVHVGQMQQVPPFVASVCEHCARLALWEDDVVVYPVISTAPEAHDELPEPIRADYDEAASIFDRSPRGAAGLLRLAIQRLVNEVEPGVKDLNTAIGKLVKRGLDPLVQQSLDAVRVIGNNALHPGEMDLRDDRDTAMALFGLVNEITEAIIARPRRVQSIYGKLPEGARKAITKRDAPKSG